MRERRSKSCLSPFGVIPTSMGSPDENHAFTLRFVDTNRPDVHAAPAGAVAQSLGALQRLVLLLAMRREGHTPGKRVRPPTWLQQRYRLVLDVPTPGSFQLPVRLEGAELLSPDDGLRISDELDRVLTAGQNEDEAAFATAVPDQTWQRFLLDAMERLAPHAQYGVDLTLFRGGHPLCDAGRLKPFADRLLRAPTNEERTAIVGKLVEIDFESKSVTLKRRQTLEAIKCSYSEAVELSLLEHPREDVVVFGVMTRDSEGEIKKVNEVDHIEPVDLSAYHIGSLLHGEEKIMAVEQIFVSVDFDEDDVLYLAQIERLGLSTFAETREQLESAVRDELSMLWREYALAEDNELTRSAQTLKRRMLEVFSAVDHAPKA